MVSRHAPEKEIERENGAVRDAYQRRSALVRIFLVELQRSRRVHVCGDECDDRYCLARTEGVR